jgi:hypothetical protein
MGGYWTEVYSNRQLVVHEVKLFLELGAWGFS